MQVVEKHRCNTQVRIGPLGGEAPMRMSLRWMIVLTLAVCSIGSAIGVEYRELPLSVYRDKMRAAWIGQMAGVAWGAPTEFRWQDKIIPEADMPAWKPSLINDAFGQDDLYVEMTFLRTMEMHGLNCSIRQAGIDFANSGYPLWCANNAGRTNLRNGIAPPDSSHPTFNKCPNDIDYQIEADYSGIIAPGMPNWPIRLGEKFGRLMNYGDGMYAGQFIGAMYATAFFESHIPTIIATALKAIPEGSQYAEMVRDLLAWFRENPDDWEATWHRIQRKYREDPEYQKASNGGIDCKINGAYVLLGLLYGKGDPDRTIIIATRAGMDSDCNPSSAAGVLFTTMGIGRVPARFTAALDERQKFSHTAYNVPELTAVCEKLMREILSKSGGRVVRRNGEEILRIPVETVRPSALELSWDPGPTAGSKFTRSEMRRIKFPDFAGQMQRAVSRFAPGWRIARCGPDMQPGLLPEWRGRTNVLLTHPLTQGVGCVLSRSLRLPAGGHPQLRLVVGHYPQGDWDLIIRVDGKEILRRTVGAATTTEGWMDVQADLAPYAGRKILLELINEPTGWSFEAAYWAAITVQTR